jgi:glutamate N-acetyltransferase / amino-acid N-acetyltransferase
VSVTFPRGFVASSATAGFKASGEPDLALLVGSAGTSAAGLFTTNTVVAAPVTLSRRRLAEGRARAVLVNSGQANAATGARGDENARTCADAAAKVGGLDVDEMLACSTGVIGEPLHVPRLLAALPELARGLSTDSGGGFARAIRTTDTVDKQAMAEAGPYRVGGCAKGVGMIAPNLATMLAFITTDAAVAPDHLHGLAASVVGPEFNALSVDGCTSTNDTVLVFASGAAGESETVPGTRDWDRLAAAVADVADSLCSQLIHDAEGVTHVLIVEIEGAADDERARTVARAVADSALVKTAIFGRDPNPGRILQAAGASGAGMDPTRLDLWIGDAQLAAGSVIPPAYFEGTALKDAAAAAMDGPEVTVRLRVGDGPGRARFLGCDLSYEYVRINGEYTT